MNGNTIYHVEIDGKHFYFGSITAIYERFTPDDLGICKTSLWSYRITEEHPYYNARCIIRRGVIFRKKTHRKPK